MNAPHDSAAIPKATRRQLASWCVWFGLASASGFALLALRYFSVVAVGNAGASLWFAALAVVAQGALLGLGLGVLLMPVALVWPRRGVVMAAGVMLATIALTLVFVDTVVYQQYRFHLDAGVWNLLAGGAAEETFVFSSQSYAKLAALGVAVLVALTLIAGLVRRWSSSASTRRARRWIACSVALVLVAHTAVCLWATAAAHAPITRLARVLPLYKQPSARGWMRRLGVEVARSDAVLADSASGVLLPRAELNFAPQEQRLNVVMLVIDSWRYDALEPRATPRLAEFARETLRFEQHVSCGNATRIGMFSLFYGIPGTYWHDVLAERRACPLVSGFAGAGYDVQTFRSAPLYSPEFDCTIYQGVPGLRLTSDGDTPVERDIDATEDFIAWIAQRDASKPYFALLFLDAPHAYAFPDDWPLEFQPSLESVDYLALGPRTDPAPFRNRYLNSVRFADSLAGRALDALRAQPDFERTLVVVTSDHGQEFNDLGQNYWGHNSNFAPPQVHVPFLMRWPGRAPRAFEHRTSHFDVSATLMGELLGCTNPPADFCSGRSLFDNAPRGPLIMATYSDFAAVLPGERYVVVRSSGALDVFDAGYAEAKLTDADREMLEFALSERTRFRPAR